MKRWQSILSTVAVTVGTGIIAQKVKDPATRDALIGALTLATGLVTNQTSKNNPDGTPAQTAWIPPMK